MIIRAKTKTLFEGKKLTEKQDKNSSLNKKEMEEGRAILESMPRRLVLELTNACNLNCIMCGRNAAEFQPTRFQLDWLKFFAPILNTIEEVTLMGWGEPTIHSQFIEILEYIDNFSARKYFCTNGMALDKIKDAIFKYHVDVFAVSLDGACAETNDAIRRGSKFNQIIKNLEEIVKIKKERNLTYPYINFVFCAMKSNLHQIPDLIRVANDIGIEEVKVVYLTVFDESLLNESLWGCEKEIAKVFEEAEKIADELNIVLKLPHIPGEDVAGEKNHKDCFVAWRDFFLGSDGFVRPCMSTPQKFFKFDMEKTFDEMWNSKEYQNYRQIVNHIGKMEEPCSRCYQSSHCNWNKKSSFIQINEDFAPEWEKKEI